MNYYGGYFDALNNTLAITCLRIEPNWMWNLQKEIGQRKLRDIFIPGSHDSASYGEIDTTVGDSIVRKYSITQVRQQILPITTYFILFIEKFEERTIFGRATIPTAFKVI